MALIFVAESDERTELRLCNYLTLKEFCVIHFCSLKELWKAFASSSPDLLIIDADFADGYGIPFVRNLRQHYGTPVIMTAARVSESKIINSFRSGCDDFVAKPYSLKELSLRISAVLRRTHKTLPCTHWHTETSEMEVCTEAHIIRVDGKDVNLTVSEWNILMYFIASAGKIVDRKKLLSVIPFENTCGCNNVDSHIKNIRAKLGNGYEWIETVRGKGYQFRGVRTNL